MTDKGIVEKNKLHTSSFFFLALEIHIPSLEEPIRINDSLQDITWQGHTWLNLPFKHEGINEGANSEATQIVLKLSNLNNVIGQHIREFNTWVKNNGFAPIVTYLYVLNSVNLPAGPFETKRKIYLKKPEHDLKEVTFYLSAANANTEVLGEKMRANYCPFQFKSIKCAYDGNETTCSKTAARCSELNNLERFGGFPGLGLKGVDFD